jgi:L-fuconolactonase
MQVDSHQHFWKYDVQRHSWITDEMEVLKRDYLPPDLLPELRADGMAGSIAVQADQKKDIFGLNAVRTYGLDNGSTA